MGYRRRPKSTPARSRMRRVEDAGGGGGGGGQGRLRGIELVKARVINQATRGAAGRREAVIGVARDTRCPGRPTEKRTGFLLLSGAKKGRRVEGR